MGGTVLVSDRAALAVLSALTALGALAVLSALAGYVVGAWPLRRLRRQLDAACHDALHDALTGAPNRKAALHQLDAAINRGTQVSLAVVDVNGMKKVNDTYGHAAGDRVLQRVAAKLQRVAAGSGATAARLGGDEFVMIIPGPLSAGVDVAWRAALAVKALPPGTPSVAVSIGVAGDAGAPTASQLLHRADKAMYYAKRHGLDVWAYEPAMSAELNLPDAQWRPPHIPAGDRTA